MEHLTGITVPITPNFFLKKKQEDFQQNPPFHSHCLPLWSFSNGDLVRQAQHTITYGKFAQPCILSWDLEIRRGLARHHHGSRSTITGHPPTPENPPQFSTALAAQNPSPVMRRTQITRTWAGCPHEAGPRQCSKRQNHALPAARGHGLQSKALAAERNKETKKKRERRVQQSRPRASEPVLQSRSRGNAALRSRNGAGARWRWQRGPELGGGRRGVPCAPAIAGGEARGNPTARRARARAQATAPVGVFRGAAFLATEERSVLYGTVGSARRLSVFS